MLDAADGPAMGASHANGGYAQVSVPDPWNAPGVFAIFKRALAASLTGRGDRSAFAVRPSALPGLIGWGRRFLAAATPETFSRHLQHNRRLAAYSRTVLAQVTASENIEYGWKDKGALIVFRDEPSMQSYARMAEGLADDGVKFEQLDRSALLEREPALGDIAGELAGALYFPDDGGGDAREFCTQLAAMAERDGVEFHFGSRAQSLRREDGGVTSTTNRGQLRADVVVIAAGCGSAALARPLGIDLPIAPAKGYSLTVPMGDWALPPRHVIGDMGVHAGINVTGGLLRIAGTAEFAGLRPGVSAERKRYMLELLGQMLPGFARQIDPKSPVAWGGHRPLCADGIPIMGRSSVSNVFVNTGHGGLGWTQAAGSGKAVADVISGEQPDIDLTAFSAERFR